MPLPRYPEAIMTAIREKYAPAKEDVLYVGPLIDGLCLFAPQLVGVATWPSEGGVEDRRRRLKHLLSSAGADGRAGNWNIRGAKLSLTRAGRLVVLGARVSETEPGELINSYQMIQDPETGETSAWEFLKPRSAAEATAHFGDRPAKPFEPIIREDKRFGLHYLLRGDLVVLEYTHRRSGAVRMEFVLKPLSEGASLLPSIGGVAPEAVW